jgi:hypothetical protein
MRLKFLFALITTLALASALLAGCGSDGDSSSTAATAPAGASARNCETQADGIEALRATGTDCDEAEEILSLWQRTAGCTPASGASRTACTIETYTCASVVADAGLAVSCAQPGRSIAFIATRS